MAYPVRHTRRNGDTQNVVDEGPEQVLSDVAHDRPAQAAPRAIPVCDPAFVRPRQRSRRLNREGENHFRHQREP
jgi:hypothetical protein